MKITILDVRGTWRQVADAARTTVKKDAGEGDPKDYFKKSITRAGHSPIRLIEFLIKVEGVKSWITVHNVRHKHGIEHWVSTQRDDRTGKNRDDAPQGTLVDYEFCVNLDELMFICQRRFCGQAHAETRAFWKAIVNALETDKKSAEIIRPVKDLFVPMCVRCGGYCPEMKCCGYNNDSPFSPFKTQLENYWRD